MGTSKTHANRLIASAEVIKNLTPIGVILPQNEAQIRPLTSLSPEDQQRIWQKALNSAPNGEVTGKHVSQIKKELIPNPQSSGSSRYGDRSNKRIYGAPKDCSSKC